MLDIQIREQLSRYLAHEISLDQFQDWFVSSTWSVHQTANEIAIELSDEIELRLAEFSNGDWTAEELRAQLKHLVESYKVASE